MTTNKKLNFTTNDGLSLSGRLYTGDNQPKSYALFIPCFTCGKDVRVAECLSENLAKFDIATFCIDFRGLGESEGDFAETTFTTQIEDIKAAYNFLATNYQIPHFFIGHSLGGTVALIAASMFPELRAIITINSPSDPYHVGRHFSTLAAQLDPEVAIEVKISDRIFKLKPRFLIDLQKYDMGEAFNKLTAKLLIIHAANDKIVNVNNAYTLLNYALPPKGFICLDSSDHMLAHYNYIDYLAGIIHEWIKKHCLS